MNKEILQSVCDNGTKVTVTKSFGEVTYKVTIDKYGKVFSVSLSEEEAKALKSALNHFIKFDTPLFDTTPITTLNGANIGHIQEVTEEGSPTFKFTC